jgi:hypothetical protein
MKIGNLNSTEAALEASTIAGAAVENYSQEI